MMNEQRSEVKKFLIYTVINGLLTLAYYLLYYVLNEYMNWYYLVSNILSYSITVVAAYVMTKYMVFQSKDWSLQEIVKFIGVRGFMLGVSSLALFFTATVLAMNKYVAFLIVTALCYLLSYSLNRMVFKK